MGGNTKSDSKKSSFKNINIKKYLCNLYNSWCASCFCKSKDCTKYDRLVYEKNTPLTKISIPIPIRMIPPRTVAFELK